MAIRVQKKWHLWYPCYLCEFIWWKQKQEKPHSCRLRPAALRPVLPPLCLRASSRTGQKPSTVLFQDSAITSGKTRFAKKTIFLSAKLIRVFAQPVFLVFLSSSVKSRRDWWCGCRLSIGELAHQGKACRHNIRDEVSHLKKGFSRFLLIIQVSVHNRVSV